MSKSTRTAVRPSAAPATLGTPRDEMTAVQRAAEVALLATLVGPVSDASETAAKVATDRITRAKSIGSAEVKAEKVTAEITAEILATLPDTFDAKARGAVSGAVHNYLTNGGAVDKPAVKSGPKGSQVSTNYGRAVDRIAKAVSAALKGEPNLPEVANITVTLGKTATAPGQTLTVKPGDAAYTALMDLLTLTTDES